MTEELALMGALRHLRSLEHRKELMEAVLQFYYEGRIYATLQQFREGLAALGVLEKVTTHPQAFENIFLQDTTSLNANDIVGPFPGQLSILSRIKQEAVGGKDHSLLEGLALGGRRWTCFSNSNCFSNSSKTSMS